MYCERTVVQRVQIHPRFAHETARTREINRALPYLLRERKLKDGTVVQSVLSCEVNRMAMVDPHGANLVDCVANARVHALDLRPGMLVRALRIRSAAGEALVGTAVGATVRVTGFGLQCRCRTPVADAPWARVKLVRLDEASGEWLAVGHGPYLGLPCCAVDPCIVTEDEDTDDEGDGRN